MATADVTVNANEAVIEASRRKSSRVEVYLRGVDVDSDEIYDAIDVDSFLSYHGIERKDDV